MLKLLYTPYIYPVTQLFFFPLIFLITLCFGFLGILYIPDLQCPHFLSEQFSNPNVTSSSQLVACCTELYMRWVCVCHKLMFRFCYHLYIFFMSRYTADGQKRYCTVYSVSVCVCVFFAVWQWMSRGTWRLEKDSVRAVCNAAAHSHPLHSSTAASSLKRCEGKHFFIWNIWPTVMHFQ